MYNHFQVPYKSPTKFTNYFYDDKENSSLSQNSQFPNQTDKNKAIAKFFHCVFLPSKEKKHQLQNPQLEVIEKTAEIKKGEPRFAPSTYQAHTVQVNTTKKSDVIENVFKNSNPFENEEFVKSFSKCEEPGLFQSLDNFSTQS